MGAEIALALEVDDEVAMAKSRWTYLRSSANFSSKTMPTFLLEGLKVVAAGVTKEVSQQIAAAAYEGTSERVAYRNGSEGEVAMR